MEHLLLTAMLLLNTQSFTHESKAIEAVKNSPDIVEFIKNAQLSPVKKVSFHEMPLDSICGFAGCESRTLVNVMITSNQSNAPTQSLLATVTIKELNKNSAPKVVIVTLK